MIIQFNIPFKTDWGQQFFVLGNLPVLGKMELKNALAMHYSDSQNLWSVEIDIVGLNHIAIEYKYILYNSYSDSYEVEGGDSRFLNISSNNFKTICYDFWNSPLVLENVFFTAPFKNVFFARDLFLVNNLKRKSHRFRVKAPMLPRDKVLSLIGNDEILGNWATNDPLIMNYGDNGYWYVDLDVKTAPNHLIEYKYAVCSFSTHKFEYYEYGENRIFELKKEEKYFTVISDNLVRLEFDVWKGVGVSVPVFSIRTENNLGVGDFLDIKFLIDWVSKVGIKLIQLLPLNDTIGTHTSSDVLPYAAISAFALNPLFLNLPGLGDLNDNDDLSEAYKINKARWNDQELVPYLEVVNFKVFYAKQFFFIKKKQLQKDKFFLKFCSENAFWLQPYAVFCVLRDKFRTSDFSQWIGYETYSKVNLDEFILLDSSVFDEIQQYYFIQFHLHLQLTEVNSYAHKNGVVLKGDIPIGVNKNSVDCWVYPELFNMNMNAGAPPDMFSIEGQNWELPTYNWLKMEETDYDWWKRRLNHMSKYFDAFRVDHILGFFRIWQIPEQYLQGKMGYLFPSMPIHISEFEHRGLHFDYSRYCTPYITDNILSMIFGYDYNWALANCLESINEFQYALLPSFQTQAQVQKLFLEKKISSTQRNALFEIQSNILFFEVEGSKNTMFYPRFDFEKISSFGELDEYSKACLRDIYVDYYFKRQDNFWYNDGISKLKAIKDATNMLVCGEDLGLMTPCVTRSMIELQILSLEVQRAPKTIDLEFTNLSTVQYLSVVSPSTHDMSTLRGWWEEDREIIQRFYNQQLMNEGEAPSVCEDWICKQIINQYLTSSAMWAIFQIQDLLALSKEMRQQYPMNERINVPSDSINSWRYRMPITIEKLQLNSTFNKHLFDLILESKR